MELYKPIQLVKGIGPKTVLLFNRLNIFTLWDLINHFPRSYEDRRFSQPINSLKDGEYASVTGEVCLIDKGRYTKSGKHMTRVVLKNETGIVVGVWFNQKYIKNNFKPKDRYLFYGKVSMLFGERQIINPEYEKLEHDSQFNITPIYPLTKNLSQKIIRASIKRIFDSNDLCINEIFPDEILENYSLCSRFQAYRNMHFPDEKINMDAAVYRIKFEELLILQLGLMMEKSKTLKNKGIIFNVSDQLKNFVAALPYELTKAQKKAVNEILSDMKSEAQMNRLIQGDVGSGKTLVAIIALFNAVKNGYQGVLMAPTEILASQHYESLTAIYKNLDIKVEFLSGKVSKKQKDSIKESLKDGSIDILVGTHALIQDDVEFNKLGLVITDEQHRFGVRQRAALNQKGLNPDILVMTATPIPRTMALFVYGDLDISIIDELPPGRQKVDTYAVKPGARQRIYNFLRKEVSNGRQAYVVCPLVEESDVMDAESAVETAQKLENQYLKGLNIGLLHGRMKSDEKDSIMLKFKNKEIDVLVSTTVIEVGINVPNATIMLIEDADHFGLAQLHQLRGRVGRGAHKSYCILISSMDSEEAKKRMQIMQEISDGFKISEKDMEMRGTGEFFGTRQHGLPELKLANLLSDTDILKVSNKLSKELVISGKIYSDEYSSLRSEIENSFNKSIGESAYN